MHCRQSRIQRQIVDTTFIGGQEGISADVNSVRAPFECFNCRGDILSATQFRYDSFKTERAGCRLCLAYVRRNTSNRNVAQNRYPAQAWDNIMQESKTFAGCAGHFER